MSCTFWSYSDKFWYCQSKIAFLFFFCFFCSFKKVGGGNYIEYQNLMDFAAQSTDRERHIMYGVSELVNANEFITQLSHLAGTSTAFLDVADEAGPATWYVHVLVCAFHGCCCLKNSFYQRHFCLSIQNWFFFFLSFVISPINPFTCTQNGA